MLTAASVDLVAVWRGIVGPLWRFSLFYLLFLLFHPLSKCSVHTEQHRFALLTFDVVVDLLHRLLGSVKMILRPKAAGNKVCGNLFEPLLGPEAG